MYCWVVKWWSRDCVTATHRQTWGRHHDNIMSHILCNMWQKAKKNLLDIIGGLACKNISVGIHLCQPTFPQSPLSTPICKFPFPKYDSNPTVFGLNSRSFILISSKCKLPHHLMCWFILSHPASSSAWAPAHRGSRAPAEHFRVYCLFHILLHASAAAGRHLVGWKFWTHAKLREQLHESIIILSQHLLKCVYFHQQAFIYSAPLSRFVKGIHKNILQPGHLWGICGEKTRKSNREKLVRVSKHHPMVYWNAGERLVCEVMSCHPAPPIPTEAHRLIGPGLLMGDFHGLLKIGL